MTTIALPKSKKRISPLKMAGLGLLASASVLGFGSVMSPASAGPVEDVQAMVTSVGGIATAAVGVVLTAMGARIAIKMVNRVATKG